MVEGATIDCMMIKKESKMELVEYYGMYSDAGNEAVADIVAFAGRLNMDWVGVLGLLEQLAKKDGFEEATDTMVREIVYDTMGFTSDFYV